MSKINLHEFKSKDFAAKLREAGDFLREHPSSTLVIDPGTYVLTTSRARTTENRVLEGRLSSNPQIIMFDPDFKYDRGLDLDGTKNARIEAYGVTILVDGFMEPISVRNCKGAEILGLTIDHKRRPYSRCKVTEQRCNILSLEFDEPYPITNGIPHMRCAIADEELGRFTEEVYICNMTYIDEYHAQFRTTTKNLEGKTLYVWHTFHSRPAILIENATKTHIKDVTVHSQPGMGITAHDSEDILIERLKVVPAEGEYMSTNTDATHFASCRGKLRLDGCMMVGMGDDGINCHSYYHNIIELEGTTLKVKATPPDGTHTQVPEKIRKGDTLEIVNAATLETETTVKVVEASFENGVNVLEIDKAVMTVDGVEFIVADRDALPKLELVNCTMKNHFARGALIKTKYALVENCTIENTFDQAIKIAPESSWKESGATEDVTIRGCRMINCGLKNKTCGGVFMYSECDDRSDYPHGKVTIENCTVETDADYAVIIRNTKSATLKNNTLSAKIAPCDIDVPDFNII